MSEVPCLLDEGTKSFLLEIANKAKDGMKFVEIDSFLGGSLCVLGNEIKKRGKNVDFTAVDNWLFENIATGHYAYVNKDKSHYEQFLENVAHLNVTSIVGDSIEIAQSDKIKDHSIDFLFIDGNHSMPYVLNELAAWIPKMKNDSILSGHDFSSSIDIQEAVNIIFADKVVNFTESRDSYWVQFGEGLC